jgi:hypothetical protein
MDLQAPEPPGRFSLRLHLYPPLQVLQTPRRRCHVAPASHLSEDSQTVGSLRSTGIPPLHHSYGLLRHPLLFRRFPEVAGYTTSLAPPVSRWDEEGFSSCLACPAHVCSGIQFTHRLPPVKGRGARSSLRREADGRHRGHLGDTQYGSMASCLPAVSMARADRFAHAMPSCMDDAPAHDTRPATMQRCHAQTMPRGPDVHR